MFRPFPHEVACRYMSAMTRLFLVLLLLTQLTHAEPLKNGYLAVSLDEDEKVVPFPTPMPRRFFSEDFVRSAPHTQNIVKNANAIKSRWRLVGVIYDKEVHDVFHEIEAFGGTWAIKTILLQVGPDTFRPLFSRETQPSQWPVEDTFFAFDGRALLLVDRFFENARIPGPYGHVLRYQESEWEAQNFTHYRKLFRR